MCRIVFIVQACGAAVMVTTTVKMIWYTLRCRFLWVQLPILFLERWVCWRKLPLVISASPLRLCKNYFFLAILMFLFLIQSLPHCFVLLYANRIIYTHIIHSVFYFNLSLSLPSFPSFIFYFFFVFFLILLLFWFSFGKPWLYKATLYMCVCMHKPDVCQFCSSGAEILSRTRYINCGGTYPRQQFCSKLS